MSVEELRQRGLIIYEVISGSRAYGTNTPTSDLDIRGVYLEPFDSAIGFDSQDQVADDKNDVIFYELKRFLWLLKAQNPNILEMLFIPDDCVVYKHPLMDRILNFKNHFLSQECKNSFGGYAVSQIIKAKGLNKKINNPMPPIRKTPLDFCYFMEYGKSVPASEFLANAQLDQQFCGLVALEHMRFTYAVYYDRHGSLRGKNVKVAFPADYKPYNGIIKSENSNDISLSEVPKWANAVGYMQFNKDAYQVHCRQFRSTTEWIANRNPERYAVTVANGNDYDSKNMMHCIRLIRVAKEIATQGVVNVRRPDHEELMHIRNGKAKYDELIQEADLSIKELDSLFSESNLPAKVDEVFINDLLIKMKKEGYKLTNELFP